MAKATAKPVRTVMASGDFQTLLDALKKKGFKVIGPTLKDDAIVCEELETVSELPIGWTDEQAGGEYHIKKRKDSAMFGYTVGPHSWKRYLHIPRTTLWEGKRDSLQATDGSTSAPRWAFLGVRPCDLNAIAIQDDVMMNGAYTDAGYVARRKKNFIVAVNCGQAGGTCFCVSMQTGPKAESNFDLCLTEILDGPHRFLVDIGSHKGGEIMAEVPHTEVTDADVKAAEKAIANAAAHMGRKLTTEGLRETLETNTENPRWEDVANRCMACANCTMVCPTCFCMTVEDYTDLKGEKARRDRRWDSCFTVEFSYIHGGSIRASAMSRYRQWMTHKLASWVTQFGRPGCVGCGRCITWCPVGIDITEEAAAIQANPVKEVTHGNA
jgi:ferredoxin